MTPSDFVIVIGRQCGSGGRALGKMLASRLSVPYYDRNLLTEAARESGLRPDVLERTDERRPSGLMAWLSASCGAADASYPGAGTDAQGFIHSGSANAVRRVMERGGCVIVGRGADYIGRDMDNMLSVFLHAPLSERLRRLQSMEFPDMTEAELLSHIARTDRRRCDYYNDFTGRRWGHADNYHLCIDTSRAGLEGAVEMILAMLQRLCRDRQ